MGVRCAALSVLLATLARLPVAGALEATLAGVLAAPVSVPVAAALAGPKAGAWAGALVALSPLHALASRSGALDTLLLLSLLTALGLLAAVDRHGHHGIALALGLPLGGLLVAGSASFAAVAPLLPATLAMRRDRRAAAGLATLSALAVVAAALLLGLARSPVDYGVDAAATPTATAAGILRCAGASLTRVMGVEYQLVVSHARYALPLSALFAALMTLGVRYLPPRVGALLVAGILAPFALGAVMAAVTGHVAPLQAHRQLAAVPFAALLLAAGLGSLRGARAWAAGILVVGTIAMGSILTLRATAANRQPLPPAQAEVRAGRRRARPAGGLSTPRAPR